jgi:hypothetical protein
MDSAIIAGLIGAAASLVTVAVGWYMSSQAERRQRLEERISLASGLAIEIMELGNDALNCHEFLKRVTERDISVERVDFDKYAPPEPLIYRAAAHRLLILGPSATTAVVQLYSELDKALRRSQQVCGLDHRKYQKAVRMEALESALRNWGYVLSSIVRGLNELDTIVQKTLGDIKLRELRDLVWVCREVRENKHQWTLSDDILIFTRPDKDKGNGRTAEQPQA